MVKTGRKKQKNKNIIEEALVTLSNYYFKTPDDVEILYLFQDGEYIQGEPTIKGKIESMFGNETNTGLCGEIINHLKRRSYVSRKKFNNFDGEIPVLNGLLNLETGELRNFTPDKIFTFKIQAKYDPQKTCPKWIKFMEEVLPQREDRLSIQEYAGYTLYPRMPFHKIAFLVGNGRNGKGSFIRTIQDILGPDNSANIRLDHLNGSHRFIATNLYGKLMNVSSEPSTRWPLQTELLKALTGEDWLDGEVKGKQNPIKFQPFAKHFVQANKLPKVSDTTLGWWDRVLITIWEQTFLEEKGNQIKDIEDTWLKNEDERSGILNWLIEGWKRLNKHKKFTQSKTQREAMIQFKRASDPIGAFLAEECEYNPEYFTLREEFYDSYKDYARSLNAEIEGNRVFWERIRLVPSVSLDKKKRIAGKNERVVMGAKIRERIEEDITLDEFKNGADGANGAGLITQPKENIIIIKEGVKEYAPSAPSAPLSELLKRTLDLFPLDRDEALRDEELFELMEKDMGLSRTESVKLIAILMREGTLFSPRPGFCKRVI
jgi:putative DNA primase/helicase